MKTFFGNRFFIVVIFVFVVSLSSFHIQKVRAQFAGTTGISLIEKGQTTFQGLPFIFNIGDGATVEKNTALGLSVSLNPIANFSNVTSFLAATYRLDDGPTYSLDGVGTTRVTANLPPLSSGYHTITYYFMVRNGGNFVAFPSIPIRISAVSQTGSIPTPTETPSDGSAYAPATITNFSVSPTSISYGDTVTVTWNALSSDTKNCALTADDDNDPPNTNAWLQSFSAGISGTKVTKVFKTTRMHDMNFVTFTLSCTGKGSHAQGRKTISVPIQKPITSPVQVQISASSPSISAGKTISLSWSSSGSSDISCVGSGGDKDDAWWNGMSLNSSGSANKVLNTPAVYTYGVICTDDGGMQGSAVTTISVNPELPRATLDISPSESIPSGKGVTLLWTGIKADSCETSWAGEGQPTQGTAYTGNIIGPKTETFWVDCIGAGGRTGRISKTVTVLAPPIECMPKTEKQTLSCAKNQSGSIIQERKSTCPSPNKEAVPGEWATISDTCTQNPPSCLPSTETKTLSCASNETGSIIQTRTSSCPDPYGDQVWKDWNDTENTCKQIPIPEVSFSTDALTISSGSGITLNWESKQASSCETSWGGQGQPLNGKIYTGSLVGPKTETYWVNCENKGGQSGRISKVITVLPAPEVKVEPLPPKADITTEQEKITAGESVRLRFSSSETSTCTNSWDTTTKTVGDLVFSPKETTEYTIKCTGPGGTVTDSVTVNVAPKPLPLPEITVSLSPETIPYESSFDLLSYEATNATYCDQFVNDTLSFAKANTKETWKNVGPYKGNQTWTFTCYNAEGKSTSKSVTLTVLPPKPVSLFEPIIQILDVIEEATTKESTPEIKQESTTNTTSLPTTENSASITVDTVDQPQPSITPSADTNPTTESATVQSTTQEPVIVQPRVETQTTTTDQPQQQVEQPQSPQTTTENTTPTPSFPSTTRSNLPPPTQSVTVATIPAPFTIRPNPDSAVLIVRPTITFNVTPINPVPYNETVIVEWKTENAIECYSSGNGWPSTYKAIRGKYYIGNILETKTFTLHCRNDKSSAQKSVTVEVAPKTATVLGIIKPKTMPAILPYQSTTQTKQEPLGFTPPKKVEIDSKNPSLIFTYTTIKSNEVENVILKWETKNVGLCIASGSWSGSQRVQGTRNIGALISGKSYTLTCNGIYPISKTVVVRSKGL